MRQHTLALVLIPCAVAAGAFTFVIVLVHLPQITAGPSWKIQPTPNPSGATGSILKGVSCTAATTCTAVGDFLNSAGDLYVTVQSKGGRFPPSLQWARPEVELTDEDRPPKSTAFRVRVEFPINFPHELAAEWAREASQVCDEMARRLGYEIPKRMRTRSVARRD